MKTFIFTLAAMFFIICTSGQIMKQYINPIGNATKATKVYASESVEESIWEKVYQLPSQQMPIGIEVVDEKTIWVYSTFYNWITPLKDEQYLYRSIDGGTNWLKMVAPQQFEFSAIDSLNVWGAGLGTGVIKTSDGGKTWDTLLNIDRFGPIHFFNQNDGIFIACYDTIYDFNKGDSIVIYRTIDGGLNWNLIDRTAYGGTSESEGCAAFNSENMCAFGDALYFGTTRNRIIYTSDKGETWHQLDSPFENPNEILVSVNAIDNLNISIISAGYMTGITNYVIRAYPSIANTKDGGVTWVTNTCLNLSTSTTFSNVPGADSISFIAAYELDNGSGGTMISTDYGETYTLIDSISNVMVMRFLDANTGFAATLNYNDGRVSNFDNIIKWKPGAYAEKEFWHKNQKLLKSCFEDTTSVTKNDAKIDFSLFPNPTCGFLQFTAPSLNTKQAQVEVFDYLGRQILTQTVSPCRMGETVTIDLNNQPVGIYLVRLKVGGEEFSGKVLLVK